MLFFPMLANMQRTHSITYAYLNTQRASANTRIRINYLHTFVEHDIQRENETKTDESKRERELRKRELEKAGTIFDDYALLILH